MHLNAGTGVWLIFTTKTQSSTKVVAKREPEKQVSKIAHHLALAGGWTAFKVRCLFAVLDSIEIA